MIQQPATVLWNQPAGPATFRLGLSCPQGYESTVPGQFVMVQSDETHAPLLRRPFSIFGVIGSPARPEGIELLYRVLGRGTIQMAQLTVGQTVDVLGPLGRGFSVAPKTEKIFLAAGGMGVAPIRFLTAHLIAHGHRPDQLHLFLGGRNQNELLCRDDFTSLGVRITLTTDDGSEGRQCLLTDPLEEAIAAAPPDIVLACGPHGMLQCVAGIAARHHVTCQISMETMMACGMGACLGCAVPAGAGRTGYLHVCKDGPVFTIDEIDLD